MHKLIIEDDEGKTTVVPLIRDEITIGRKEGNTIRLTERNVSRRHARLMKSNGHVFIEDLQSYNGIKVNGDRIAGKAPINEGDRIQIGDYQLALKLDKSAPTPQGATTGANGADNSAPVASMGSEKTDQFGDPATAAIPIAASPAVRAKADAPTQANPVFETPTQVGSKPDIAGLSSSAGATDRPARLVVVSSNFAGTEFKLDKPTLVIGRTNDSDLVVDHRSISRQHARVYRENGRYHIEDLKSANGVRVNGEEYGKVELRKGDFIDLGHVRLRFVGPNEDFVFARDAHVVDVEGSAGKSRNTIIAAALAVLVILVGGFVVVRMMGSGRGDGAKASGDNDAQLAKLNVEVDKALRAEEWDSAIALASQGLQIDPGQEVLRDKKDKATAEKKNQVAFDKYGKAAKDGNNEEAVARYQEIADGSVYRDKAASTWPIVKTAYIKDHLAQARALQAASKCDEARKHVESVLFIDEGNQEAQDLARKCGQPPPVPHPHTVTPHTPEKEHEHIATQTPSHNPAPVAPTPRTPEPVAPAPSAGASDDDERLVKEALDDYVHGNYSTAIEKAKKANKGGGNSKAWRVIGASSCFLKDKSGAVSAWNKLSTMDRKFLQYVCQRNAIPLP